MQLGIITRLLIPSYIALSILSGSAGAQSTGASYVIGPEDVLEVSVWREETLQKELVVRPDGWITFPLVGDIKAAGRTLDALTDEIRVRLTRYISDPVVTVSVKKIAANKIFVLGKVNKPGEYVIGRYVDVLQVLALAGGLTPFAADSKIKILRKQNGKELVFDFDYTAVKNGRNLKQNITLKGGDVIIVP